VTPGTVSTVEESGQDMRVVEQAAGKVVKTIVMIKADPGVLIRAGMTGRAKIDGKTMPLILVFSRSLVRFISVEMWSWLP
jgi:putative peptide zinc metalloprotease protein